MISQQCKKWMSVAAVPALIGALALGGTSAATAQTDLPDKSPEEVLQMMAEHNVTAFSGDWRASFDLGLPELPETGDGHSYGPDPFNEEGSSATPSPTGDPQPGEHMGELLSMLSGTHEGRIFVDGKDKSRFQVFDGTNEKNHIHNGTDVWYYDSASNTAVHTTLPEDAGSGWCHGMMMGGSEDGAPTPEEFADGFLEKVGPTTEVTVEEGATVAGRDVYTLVMDPRPEEQTLVDVVNIGVDAETGTPLSFEVRAVDQEDPAVRVEFTSFTPEAPDPALFDFEPPAGATVEEKEFPGHGMRDGMDDDGMMGDGMRNRMDDDGMMDDGDAWCGRGMMGMRGQHKVVGEGWDSVVVMPQAPRGLDDSGRLDNVATEVEGGRLISTSLVNVLLTDDGRVLAGSVPLERLQQVADEEASSEETAPTE